MAVTVVTMQRIRCSSLVLFTPCPVSCTPLIPPSSPSFSPSVPASRHMRPFPTACRSRRRQIATLKVRVRNRENYYFCTFLLVLHRTLSGRISVIFPARMAGIYSHYNCIPKVMPVARVPLHIPQIVVFRRHIGLLLPLI